MANLKACSASTGRFVWPEGGAERGRRSRKGKEREREREVIIEYINSALHQYEIFNATFGIFKGIIELSVHKKGRQMPHILLSVGSAMLCLGESSMTCDEH